MDNFGTVSGVFEAPSHKQSWIHYYYYYYYYDFTVHKTKGNMAIKYEIVTECTEGTPVRGAGALGMDRALQRTNNIK